MKAFLTPERMEQWLYCRFNELGSALRDEERKGVIHELTLSARRKRERVCSKVGSSSVIHWRSHNDAVS